jgi:hypothetical protein
MFDFYDTFSNYAEISLVAENKFVNVGARANSWGVLTLLEGTDRSRYLYANNDIVYISVFIFLHTRSSCTDPAPQGAELN